MFENEEEQAAEIRENEESESAVETVYLPETEYTPSKDYSAVGFGTLAFFIMWHVLVMIMTVLYFAVSNQSRIPLSYAIMISLVGELLSIPVFVFIVRKKENTAPEKNRLRFGEMMSFLSVSFFVGIFGNIIGRAVNSLISSSGGTESVSKALSYMSDELPLMAVYAAIIGPVLEELVFRKFLLDRISRYGKPIAMITSGILFGLAHGNIEQFFYTVMLGALFAYVYLRTGNIKYTIMLHMIVNGLSTLVSYIVTKIPALETAISDPSGTADIITRDKDQMSWLIALVVLVLLEYALAIIGLITFITHLKSYSFGEDASKNASLKKCYCNPGMILCLIGFFALLILSIFGITL